MAFILEAVDDYSEHIYTDRERELIHILRTMLKDYPDDNMLTLNHLVEQDRGERWSDQQLLVYIQQGVADVNSEPPLTSYTVENFPTNWQSCMMTGALIFALLAETIKQSGESFSYSDNGLSLSIDVAAKYQGVLSTMLSAYSSSKQNLKRSCRPKSSSIKSGPSLRLRTYCPRQWVYR
jgi:hypothetical protein